MEHCVFGWITCTGLTMYYKNTHTYQLIRNGRNECDPMLVVCIIIIFFFGYVLRMNGVYVINARAFIAFPFIILYAHLIRILFFFLVVVRLL